MEKYKIKKFGLILEHGVYLPADNDGFDDMIQHKGLKDDSTTPCFVRFEFVPKGDVFNHNKDNWTFKVDQDYLPDWFDKAKAEKRAWEQMQEWFKERFIVDNDEWQEKEGRLYVRNAKVVAWGNSSVEAWGNSSVVAWGNSSVLIPCSTDINIKGIYDNATVKDLSGSPKIYVSNPKIELVKFENPKK